MATTKPISSEELPQVLEVFEHWKEHLGSSRMKLTKERGNKIVARLRSGFTVAELKQVIEAVVLLPWWRGQNNRNTPYDDIINIFRNDTRTESFLITNQSLRTDTSLSSTEHPDGSAYHSF